MEPMFETIDLRGTHQNQLSAIRTEVEAQGEDNLLNVSEEDLVAALCRKFKWNPPVLGQPQIASDREVKEERNQNDYGRHRAYTAPLTEIVIHIPYSGDTSFFRMQPPHRQWETPKANIRSDCLEIVFRVEKMDGERIRQSIDTFVNEVRYHLDQLVKLSDEHNASLAEMARSEVQARKKRILDRRNLVASIGLPLRHRDGASQTYSVPNVRRKPEVQIPQAGHTPFFPEPVLAESEYENILAIMKSMVRVMEASPHAFSTMKEEDLRQHFLVQLNGQYQCRATGETFNYEGQTDILIRENERNVFIGECKFWKGPDSLTKTIDQILGYLHWRDTRAAIAMFNRNKDFTNVLSQIVCTTQDHPCFKRFVRQVGETEWRFVFSNKDDVNREVHLAIMLFDIPKAP